MRAWIGKTLAAAATVFVSSLSGAIALLMAHAAYILLLRLPSMEGPGPWQPLKIMSGGALLLLLPIAWLGLAIYASEYFSTGVRDGTLGQRFAWCSAMLLYLFPLLVLVYELAFPSAMIGFGLALPVEAFRLDWWLAGGGLLLGSAMLLAYRSLARRRASPSA